MRRMAVLPRPFNRFLLSLKALEDVVRMVFDHVVVDRIAFWSTLRPCLNEYVRHCCFLRQSRLGLNRSLRVGVRKMGHGRRDPAPSPSLMASTSGFSNGQFGFSTPPWTGQ